ncbi:MAG: TonB-dependent receptor [Bdellovibrionota bacterium]
MKFAFVLFFLSLAVCAEVPETLQTVDVIESQPYLQRVKNNNSSPARITSDTASLLNNIPGVSFQTGGGISSLPVIHGMADDRINIQIDGASVTSSCSNHMNPALSYVDPSKVSVMDVWAGVTPVRFGGDSIGGSVIVKSKDPEFSKKTLTLKSFYKSNNENRGGSLNFGVADKKTFVGYSGFEESAHNYRDGRGSRIKSTLYNQNNQSATIGRKIGEGVLSLKLTRANVPYQGFINQYMDLADNVSNLANLGYTGLVGDVVLESSLFYQHTNHLMDVLRSERTGAMPMYTRSDEAGLNVKASFEMSATSLLTVGTEYRYYRLNDWWPALPGVTSIMGPGTFESIKNGKRDRLGLFLETDSDWTKSFSTNLGIRTDIVSMDTDDVRGYNTTDNLPADSAAFNSKSHIKRDHNYDATILSKFKSSQNLDLELGLARKTRSPNLYERYAWAGSVTDPTVAGNGAGMDMLMINWFGDGNGYVGDISLRPEVAHKISTSFIAHDENKSEWEVKLTPYYSEVRNFIDADFIGSSNGNNFLKFANHDAVIFGGDLSTSHRLTQKLSLKTIASYTRGYRKDGKANLYHLMPLNGKVMFQYTSGKWTSDLVTHLVNKKEQVNELRLEPATGSYALLDLATSYQATKLLKLEFAINNVFDLTYGLPLGGVDLVNHTPSSRTTVVGMGRSFNTVLTMDFF